MNTALKILLAFMLMVTPAWGGVNFDRTDDSFNANDVPSVDGSAVTWSFWVTVDDTSDQNIFLWKYNVGTDQRSWQIATDSENLDEVEVTISSSCTPFSGWQGKTTSTNLSSSWQHIAVVFDGSSNDVKVYKDGVDQGALTTETGSIPSSIADCTSNMYIGRTDSGADLHWLGGNMTEIAIWNTNLSSTEVLLLASSHIKRIPLQIQPSNLQVYYPMDSLPNGDSFDEKSLKDISGNGNDATGSDGSNNTGLTAKAEEVLSYHP